MRPDGGVGWGIEGSDFWLWDEVCGLRFRDQESGFRVKEMRERENRLEALACCLGFEE